MNEPEQQKPILISQPGVVATAGEVSQSVVSTLGAQPVLLLIMLLNICMIGAASWFLLAQEEYRHLERLEIVKLFDKCMGVDNAKSSPQSH